MAPPSIATGSAGAGSVWTVVVAGGSGVRFGQPKQYELIAGRRVVDLAVALAARCSAGVVLVVPAADVERECVAHHGSARVVAGGSSRSGSVRAGLAAVPADVEIVAVHDAARPFASDELFARVVNAVRSGADGAVPGIPVPDTIKRVDADGAVIDTPDRSRLVAVQTPQAFRASVLRSAHDSAVDSTDDAALVEAAGGRVVVVEGDLRNRKITLPEDLEWARSVGVGAS